MKRKRMWIIMTSLGILTLAGIGGYTLQMGNDPKEEYIDLSKLDQEKPEIIVGEKEAVKPSIDRDTENTEALEETAGKAKMEREKNTDTIVEKENDIKPRIQNKIDNFSFKEGSSLIWPVSGTILMDYSMDKSVYFKTLNQYKYNPSLLIHASVNEPVLAAARGRVVDVREDEETGTTLTIDIGDGYQLTYGQLKEVPLAVGNIVEAKEIIGYVDETTKYYSEEGTNLYFKMTLYNQPVNPVDFLEMEETE